MSTEPRRSWFRLAPVAVFAAIASFFGYALFFSEPSKLPSALIGKPAPATEFPAIPELLNEGQNVPGFKSADFADGKIKVINFWASWCTPCVDEHPLLIELKAKTNIDVFGVNYKDQPEAARRFLGRYGNPFTAVGADSSGRNAIEWGVYGMPESFVVDGQGRIVYKHVGPITERTLETALLPAIEKAKTATASAQ